MSGKQLTKGQKFQWIQRIIKSNNLLILNDGTELKELTELELNEIYQAIHNRSNHPTITWLEKGNGKWQQKNDLKQRKTKNSSDLGTTSFVCSNCSQEYTTKWSDIFDLQECTHGFVGFYTNEDYIACPFCGGSQITVDYSIELEHELNSQKSNHIVQTDSDDIPF